MKAKKPEKSYEAWGGLSVVSCGKRKNGKPHNVLVLNVMVVTSKSDVAAMTKAYPQLKFFECKPRKAGKEPVK
jgi:hypothetical protein